MRLQRFIKLRIYYHGQRNPKIKTCYSITCNLAIHLTTLCIDWCILRTIMPLIFFCKHVSVTIWQPYFNHVKMLNCAQTICNTEIDLSYCTKPFQFMDTSLQFHSKKNKDQRPVVNQENFLRIDGENKLKHLFILYNKPK